MRRWRLGELVHTCRELPGRDDGGERRIEGRVKVESIRKVREGRESVGEVQGRSEWTRDEK